MKINNIDDIVNGRLCIGCMACVCMCPLGALETKKGDYGFPVPIKHKDCNDCGICLLECPTAADDDE